MFARKITASRLILVSFLLLTLPVRGADTKLQRQDFFVASDPGVRLFVRQVTANAQSGHAVLLLHGARVPGLASFDLPVPGGSLAADLALSGLDVYIMDVRGYGQSTRPPEM